MPGTNQAALLLLFVLFDIAATPLTLIEYQEHRFNQFFRLKNVENVFRVSNPPLKQPSVWTLAESEWSTEAQGIKPAARPEWCAVRRWSILESRPDRTALPQLTIGTDHVRRYRGVFL